MSVVLGLISVCVGGDAAAGPPVHFCQVNSGSPFCTGGQSGPTVYDIATFGACPGDPATNHERIQEAILQAATNGSWNTVKFSCMVTITQPLEIYFGEGFNPVALVGQGNGGIQLAGDLPHEGAALLLNHCDNCLVYGMTFQSAPNATATPRSRGILLKVESSTDIAVYDNTFKWVGTNFGPDGIQNNGDDVNAAFKAQGNVSAEYVNNTVTLTDPYCRGMWIGNNTAQTYEYSPKVSGNQISWTGHSGIALVADGAIVENNVVTDVGSIVNGVRMGAGIAVSAPDIQFRTKNTLITGNSFLRAKVFGIQSDGFSANSPRTFNITVTNNTCDGNGASGIYAVNADSWTVTGNHCRNNNADGVSMDAGIYVDAADGILIDGNEFSDTRSEGARTQNVGIWIQGTEVGGVRCVTARNNNIANNLNNGIFVGAAYQQSNPDPVPNLHTKGVNLYSNIITVPVNACGINYCVDANFDAICDTCSCGTCKMSTVYVGTNSFSGNGTNICGVNSSCEYPVCW